MEVSALKKSFATALFTEPGNAFKAAMQVFPNDVQLACSKAVEWINDGEVLAEIDRLKQGKEKVIERVVNMLNNLDANDKELPTKEDALLLAWNMAQSNLEDGKDRVNALKLFLEASGHMPDKTINKNIKTETKINKVMIIRDKGNDKEWEENLVKQQSELING